MRAAALLTLIAALLAGAPARAQTRLVAVLPLDVKQSNMDTATRVTLEEAIRTIAGEALLPLGYTVLTGETTLAVLAENDIDPTKACEASCALEAARELKADLFISGTVTKSEGYNVAFIRLFEARSGRQLGALELEGQTVREIRKAFNDRASTFFRRLLGTDQPQASTAVAPSGPASSMGSPQVATTAPRGGSDPAATRPISRAGDRQAPAISASLTVETQPPGLTVTVDGQVIGTSTVADHLLQPGVYQVGTSDNCHEAIEERVILSFQEKKKVVLAPRPRTTRLRIEAVDSSGSTVVAQATVDGQPLGRAPGTYDVPVCARRIEISGAGGNWSGTLSLREGEQNLVRAPLSVAGRGPSILARASSAGQNTARAAENAATTAATSFSHMPQLAPPKLLVRGGLGFAHGLVGASAEYRTSGNLGYLLGVGIPWASAGVTLGPRGDESGFYADAYLFASYIPDFFLPGGLGANVGYDFRFLSSITMRIGLSLIVISDTDGDVIPFPMLDFAIGAVALR